MAERPTRIFISYAHADHAHLAAFRQHFGPVEHGRNLEVWFDGELAGGQVWNDRIRRAINASDIFVCLVTSAFLNSSYIRDSELPAIWHAVRGRSALLLPVILEQSFWQQEFGQVQCLPATPKGILRPAADWRPKRNGLHAAAEQAERAILAWLAKLPPLPADPGPGAGLVVTPDGFDLVPDVPGPAERADPLQLQLLAGVRGRWRTLIDDAQSCRNTHPVLHRELVAYGDWIKAELADLDVVSLVTAGSALSGVVESLKPPLPSGVMTEPLEPALLAGFETLLREHARLIYGFTEGRELIARDRELQALQDHPATMRQTLHSVLRPMAEARGLLTAQARELTRMLDEALMEAGLRSADLLGTAVRHGGRAVGALARAVGSKVHPAEALTYAGFAAIMAGDPNFETYRAAFQFLAANTTQLSAFAASIPELRRLVDWTAEQLGARTRPAPAKDGDPRPQPETLPNNPPEGFDIAEVHAIILRGEAPPWSWVPWIRELNFFGSALNDLTPIAGLINLTSLNCSHTQIEDLAPIAGLANLATLNCSGTQIADLAPIAGLTNLMNLYCSETQITDLAAIAGLTKLTDLYCVGTQITDLAPIAGLTNLTLLCCIGTHIIDLAPIAGLTNLTDLYCSGTQITNLAPIAGLTNLTTIDCSETRISSLAPLTHHTERIRLYLADLQVEAIDLSPLLRLRVAELVLMGTPVLGGSAPAIAKYQIDPDGTVHDPDTRASGTFNHYARLARERYGDKSAPDPT